MNSKKLFLFVIFLFTVIFAYSESYLQTNPSLGLTISIPGSENIHRVEIRFSFEDLGSTPTFYFRSYDHDSDQFDFDYSGDSVPDFESISVICASFS